MTEGKKKGSNKMHKIGLTQTGSVIVEMTVKEYEALQLLNGGDGQLADTTSEKVLSNKVYPAPTDAVAGVSGDQMTLKQAVDYCSPRLVKLRPKKKSGVINGLHAMFNFQGGVSDERAEEIYQALRNKGVFAEVNGRIEYP